MAADWLTNKEKYYNNGILFMKGDEYEIYDI
jgi:hypothetical protein